MSIGKLTGPKKAAILLMALGEEGAADVIKNLDDSEIQSVGYFMSRFTDISPEELDMVLDEFYNKSVAGIQGFSLNPSADFVKNTLTKALGGDRAKSLVDNLSASVEESGLQSLKWLDAKAIANVILHEHPQTIGLILAYLEDPDQTAAVLRELPENLQAEVVYRMAILESVQPGVVAEIDEVLTREMQTAGAVGASKMGGIESVAEVLNSLDKMTETRILATIEESNPDLAEQIRELMFTFEDLVLIDTRGMQLILKDHQGQDLALAMKTASDPIKELIFSSMSQRAADMLREDLEVLGPVKVSDVEKSQQVMVKIARKLEEEGKIIIGGRGGGEIV